MERRRSAQEMRCKMTERVKTTSAVGSWYTFEGIITQEMGGGGGPPTKAAVRGAVNRCMKCIDRGPRFVRINKDSLRLEFKRVQDSEILNHSSINRSIREERNDTVRATLATSLPSSSNGAPAQAPFETPPPQGQKPAENTPPPVDQSKGEYKGQGENQGKGQGKGKQENQSSPNKDKGKGKGQKGKKVKAQPKARPGAKAAATPKSVASKAKACTLECASVVSRSRNLLRQIEDPSDAKYKWADTERFKGRLLRHVQKVEAKLGEYNELYELQLYNTALPSWWTDDVHTSMSQIEDLNQHVETLSSVFDRIMDLGEEDQPSQ
eukprot:3902048-Pyramimonas_sp.AAC.2